MSFCVSPEYTFAMYRNSEPFAALVNFALASAIVVKYSRKRSEVAFAHAATVVGVF